jgi:hypothetical protein
MDDSGFPRTPDKLLKFCGIHVWLLEVFKIMTSTCGPYNLGGSTTGGPEVLPGTGDRWCSSPSLGQPLGKVMRLFFLNFCGGFKHFMVRVCIKDIYLGMVLIRF